MFRVLLGVDNLGPPVLWSHSDTLPQYLEQTIRDVKKSYNTLTSLCLCACMPPVHLYPIQKKKYQVRWRYNTLTSLVWPPKKQYEVRWSYNTLTSLCLYALVCHPKKQYEVRWRHNTLTYTRTKNIHLHVLTSACAPKKRNMGWE